MTNNNEKRIEFGKKLKAFREQNRWSQEDLAEKLGYARTRSFISQVENGQVNMPKKKLTILENEFNFTGQILNDDSNSVPLDYYPEVFASCGNGAVILSEQKEIVHIPQKFLSFMSKDRQYSLINSIGDSMQPFIMSKDLLVIEHNYLGEQIKDNHIYVFCYCDEIFIKRLSKNINQIVIKSDNSDYPIRILEKEELNDVKVIGEVRAVIRDLG